MTAPHEVPTFFSATQANPKVNGLIKWGAVFLVPGIVAWAALIVSVVSFVLAVAK